MRGELFRSYPAQIFLGGGLGYIFILLMSLTSNDQAVKLLGVRRWKILHSIGAYYLWFIFFFTYFGDAKHHPLYFSLTLVLIAALAFKIVIKFNRP
jgi:DMSO/TMAO reductase YedYZ heme-binding membrane subunit